MMKMSEKDMERNETINSGVHDHSAEEKTKEEVRTDLVAFTVISQTGLMIVIPIVLGAAAGHWLDEKLGTGIIFFVILLLVGIAAGFYGAYDQINSVIKWKK
jgi:ATP synthase protein I